MIATHTYYADNKVISPFQAADIKHILIHSTVADEHDKLDFSFYINKLPKHVNKKLHDILATARTAEHQ